MRAGAFLPPDLLARRQNFSFKKQFFFAVAAQADSVNALRSQGLPPVVRLLLLFPALRLFPGQTPAHELKCLLDGNCRMSAPVSASTLAALRSCKPGMVCSFRHCSSSPATWIWFSM